MKRLLILLLLVALLLPLVSCNKGGGTTATTTAATSASVPETEPLACSVAPAALGNSVPIHTAVQYAYFANADANSAVNYAEGQDELSRPIPITLSWDVDFTANENDLWYFVVRIWTKTDKSDARSILVGRSERQYRFYNAFIAQTYYWDVTAYGTTGATFTSPTATFTTDSQAPRVLYVDGVTNVRDLGGRVTEDGGRVRQGLLFRGGQLNDNEGTRMISDEGIKTMRQTFGIKTELDLRASDEHGGITKSFLGNDVKYYRKSGTTKITSDYAPGYLQQVFEYLANERNYPLFFHCIIGTDRTGMIAWLVNGLCGVSEEDLWRDYLFSNFGRIGGTRKKSKIQDGYVKELNTAAKSAGSYAKGVYNYLKDTIGIPSTTLDAVIRILKVQPGETVENNTSVRTEHKHVAESKYTVISAATCSTPGVKVKYCTVCGEFIEDTLVALPIDPDAHDADWNVIRQPTVVDQADGSRRGTCVYCGKFIEQTTVFSPAILTCTDKTSGKASPYQIAFADILQGGHFYPTANNSAGNDLLIEYSVFYNGTMLNLDTDKCDPYATTRINAEAVAYWSPTVNVPDAWCKFAGGFEATGGNFKNAVSDGTVTTPTKMTAEGGGYADYPNIGGSNQSNPAYGWHRIGIRIHEEVANASTLKKDAAAGKTQATYVLTETVYFDGKPAYKLKTDESKKGMNSSANLLYTASSDGKGGIVYTDIDPERYVIPFQLNDTTAKSGTTAYVVIADVSVSCGKDFVQQVEKLTLPAGSVLTVAPDKTMAAPVYYRLK